MQDIQLNQVIICIIYGNGNQLKLKKLNEIFLIHSIDFEYVMPESLLLIEFLKDNIKFLKNSLDSNNSKSQVMLPYAVIDNLIKFSTVDDTNLKEVSTF